MRRKAVGARGPAKGRTTSKGKATAKARVPSTGSPRPQTRAERRRSAQVRRSRFLLAGSVVVAAIVLAAWFPLTTLLHQRSSLASASSELSTLRSSDKALAQEQKRLGSSAEIERIARQQYQLVSPGQQVYEVLPPNDKAGATGVYAGDPGLQEPVDPSAASELPPSKGATTPGVTTTTTTAPSTDKPTSAGSSDHPGLLTRIAQTLEFWR